MTYQNDGDDDILIYDSSVSKSALWSELIKLRDRIDTLEQKIARELGYGDVELTDEFRKIGRAHV